MILSSIKKLISRNEWVRQRVYRLAISTILRPYIAQLKVPIIAVTGTNGKTTITRLLHRIYLNAGFCAASCSTYGVLHNDRLVFEGDNSDAGGGWKAAQCSDVDILILETARGGLLKYGVGFYQCHIGIVSNVYEDHLGFDGIHTIEEMAELKSLIPKHTSSKGAIILNGDDDYVKAMADKSTARPIYFVLNSDHKPFESAFFLKDNWIWKKIGGDIEKVISVEAIPLTAGGARKYHIANIMAVLGALEGMKPYLPVGDASIHKTLSEFGKRPQDVQGKCFVTTYKGEHVALFDAKNPASFAHEAQMIQKIIDDGDYQHIVGILTAPGNRNEKYYNEMSKLAAQICDKFVVHPPASHYLRGREEAELVRLLSIHLPDKDILSKQHAHLDDIITLSNDKLQGKKLFIVLYYVIETHDSMLELLDGLELKQPHFIPMSQQVDRAGLPTDTAESGGVRRRPEWNHLFLKVQRNIQEAGIRITTQKIISYCFRALYEERVYRIYGIDLTTHPPFKPEPLRFSYRLIAPADENFIQQVEDMAEWLKGKLKNRLEGDYLCLVALDDNNVVGFNLVGLDQVSVPLVDMTWQSRRNEAWSEQITVLSNYRNNGLGLSLRHNIFKELKRLGIKRLYGGTLTNNSAALALARRAGFHEIYDLHYQKIFTRKSWQFWKLYL